MKVRNLFVIASLVLVASLLSIAPIGADGCPGPPPNCEPPPPPPPCADPPDPRTPGYWKNHPEAWRRCSGDKVTYLEEITICCESCSPCGCEGCDRRPKSEVIEIMDAPVKGDKTYTMFDALIAAKLNRSAGADVSCINWTINRAAEWMCDHPVGSGVKANSDAWQEYEWVYEALDEYNNYGCSAP